MSPLRSDRFKSWLMPALVALLALIAYWPALHGALLWDDRGHVTRPEIQSWNGLWRIWSDVRATQQYYPVLHSAFWIEHRLWGDATLGYHLVNVLWHVVACCLFAVLLRRLWDGGVCVGAEARTKIRPEAGRHGGLPLHGTVPRGAEWLAALLLAVHPLSVESVAWISEQKNTLSLVFYLLAALAYLKFARERRASAYVLATVCFILALGSKTVTATLPAALLVVLWWRNGPLQWRRDIFPLVPWFFAAATAGLFTAWVERKLIGAEGAVFDLSLVERVLLASHVVWFYAGKLVWPWGQAFFYDRWDVHASATSWIGYLVTALVVTGALWYWRARCRGLLAGWLLFVGALFPALGFFNVYPFAFSYVADHFQYLASLAFFGSAAGAIALLRERASPVVRVILRTSVGTALVILLLLANRQSRLYVNDETLFRHTIAQTPQSWIAHSLLGFSLTTSGQHAAAIDEFRTALRLNPDYPNAHVGLALELAQQPGEADEAIAHFNRALELNPSASDAHNNLALLLSTLPGRLPQAILHYEAALRIKPRFAEAHANLASALATLPERTSDALEHYQSALRLAPESAEMHENYAGLLARLPGRVADAIAEHETALRLKPDFAEAHAGLANALALSAGRIADAHTHFERALELNPNVAETHYNFANALRTVPGRTADAISHYETALRLRPAFFDAHANLANMLAQLPGRQTEAIAHYEAALQIDANVAWVHLALANQLADTPARASDAIAHAEAALRLKPNYPAAHNCLALVFAQAGRLDEAAAHWTEAVRIDPTNETARANLHRLEQMIRR